LVEMKRLPSRGDKTDGMHDTASSASYATACGRSAAWLGLSDGDSGAALRGASPVAMGIPLPMPAIMLPCGPEGICPDIICPRRRRESEHTHQPLPPFLPRRASARRGRLHGDS